MVAQDELNESGALRSLYASSAFATFAANIVGVEKLHVMGDELAGCTGEILREGQVGRSLFFPFSPCADITYSIVALTLD